MERSGVDALDESSSEMPEYSQDGTRILKISDTGATFNDVPITMSKSIFRRSCNNDRSNRSLSFSPKNVMSG